MRAQAAFLHFLPRKVEDYNYGWSVGDDSGLKYDSLWAVDEHFWWKNEVREEASFDGVLKDSPVRVHRKNVLLESKTDSQSYNSPKMSPFHYSDDSIITLYVPNEGK